MITNMKNRTSVRAISMLLLAATAALWSIGGLLIKSIEINPLAIAGVRSAIAAVLLLMVLRKPKFTWSYAQIGAAAAYAATTILFVSANKTTTAANAVLLQFTAPIYIAVLGPWLLKEKTRLFDWITIFVIFGGMFMFFLDGLRSGNMTGNLIAAASGISFALFNIFMRMQKQGSPLESVFLGNIITAVIGMPFLLQAVPSAPHWLSLFILGIAQLGIPYILYAKAIKHTSALETTLILFIEPLLNPLWVFLILGEAPSIEAFVGGFLVIAAIIAHCIYTSSLEKAHNLSNQ